MSDAMTIWLGVGGLIGLIVLLFLGQSKGGQIPQKGVSPGEQAAQGCVGGCSILVVLFFLLPSMCSSGSSSSYTPPPAPAPPVAPTVYDITYEVTGSTSEASLTYKNSSGGTDQMTVSLPWIKKFVAAPGTFLYISAQNKSDSGTIEARIKVNGAVVQSGQSNSEYGIASASGRL